MGATGIAIPSLYSRTLSSPKIEIKTHILIPA